MYDDLAEDDQFKLRDKIFETDIRFKAWGAAKDINYLHEQLLPLSLQKNVPQEIRVEFDMARNTFLYSHFSYMMTNVSAQIALGVLEKYLKYHLKEVLKLELKQDTLAPLIKYSIENEIITSNFFKFSVFYNKDHQFEKFKNKEYIKRYFVRLKDKRNNLTHDSYKADIPWNNLDVLRDVSAVINFLASD